MTKTIKLTTLLLTTGLCAAVAFSAFGDQKTQDYKIRLMKDCAIVSEQAMTSSQVAAYLALKEQEQLMHGLELPIKAIEDQMHEYSAKIEELTALAVQETKTSIHIDKTYMKQQEEVAHKLNHLVSSHQKDFDALHLQGSQIGKVARAFEQEIEPSTADISYDQIQIISPHSKASSDTCHRGIFQL